MERIMFFYSIFIITLCAIAITPALFLFCLKKRPVYGFLALLFGSFVVELVELHYIAFFELPQMGSTYEITHISFPALRIASTFVILLLDLLILLWIMEKPWKNQYLLLFLPMFIWSIYLSFQPQSMLNVWLFYSIRQFYRFGYCIFYGISYLKAEQTAQKARLLKYSFPIFGAFLLNCAILLEDSLVISHIDFFLFDVPIITERNFSENMLWIFLCSYSFWILIQQLNLGADTAAEAVPAAAAVNSSPALLQKLPEWITFYKLTPREAEILALLIQYRNTSDICEELSISIGTVKTHTHNIYTKIGVNGKNELIKKLMEF